MTEATQEQKARAALEELCASEAYLDQDLQNPHYLEYMEAHFYGDPEGNIVPFLSFLILAPLRNAEYHFVSDPTGVHKEIHDIFVRLVQKAVGLPYLVNEKGEAAVQLTIEHLLEICPDKDRVQHLDDVWKEIKRERKNPQPRR